ncbi:MAG: DsbA family protein [Roseateles sp.]
MNRRALFVGLTAAGAVAAFATGAVFYQRGEQQQASRQASASFDVMVREHSPVMGPSDAPVTIVEFFDPACEACRAFYPFVKQTLAAFPRDVRLVMRYVPFHQEPSVVGVQILEAARRQDKFEAVLEALLRDQPVWASHQSPSPSRAWDSAKAAGLDLEQAKAFVDTGVTSKLLEQDVADLKQVGVRATPTFFVNGKPLTQVDPQTLHDLVKSEVEASRRSR